MKLAVVGVFCAQAGLMDTVKDDQALVRVTMRRVVAASLPTYALVPWTKDLDHLAAELRGWRYMVQRCHPDERVAMRDLVAKFAVDVGIVVNGACAVVDEAEIRLALARVSEGFDDGRYMSPRVKAMASAQWLRVSDTDEWPEPTTSAAEALKFYGTRDPKEANARQAWAELKGAK